MARQSSSREVKATFTEHLGELRRRLIVVLIVLGIGMVIGMYAAGPLIEYLKQTEPAKDIEWNVFSPWDSLRIYMNVSIFVAIVITLPAALYELWAFVKPALREEERRVSVMYVPFAVLLALAGAAFGYFVLFPLVFRFTSFLSDRMGLVETYGAAQYFTFMFNIVVPVAFVFELPLIMMFLTKLRIMTPKVMHRWRKYAYFFMFVISAVITPSPDMLSAILLSIPLFLLYEFSVMLSRNIYRKQQEADRRLEQMLSEPY